MPKGAFDPDGGVEGGVAQSGGEVAYVVGEDSPVHLGSAVVEVAGVVDGVPEKEVALVHEATFREFVRWGMLTTLDRAYEKAPETVRAFSERYGVSVATLTAWTQTAIYREMRRYLLDKWGEDSLPHLLRAAHQSAMRGGREGHADRKMLLLMQGVFVDKKRVEHAHSGSVAVTGEAIVEHRASLPEHDLRAAALDHLRRTQPGRTDADYEALLDAVLALEAAQGGAARVPKPPHLSATGRDPTPKALPPTALPLDTGGFDEAVIVSSTSAEAPSAETR